MRVRAGCAWNSATPATPRVSLRIAAWEIDRHERNRSRFVLHSIQRELDSRRREELRRSLNYSHAESETLAEVGEHEWLANLPDGDEDLLDPETGQAVRWTPGQGWIEE